MLFALCGQTRTADYEALCSSCVIDVLIETVHISGSHLVVVTGRGIHSVNNTARVKPAVINYLRQHGYRYVNK